MDNSPAWDAPLDRVPVDDLPPYERRDTGHVDASMRPRKADYDRYLTLLYRFRAAGYDPARLYHLSPFRATDLCTNSILHRANVDLLWLAGELGHAAAEAEIQSWIDRARPAFDELWDASSGIYRSRDQLTEELLPAATASGFLPLYARTASPSQAAALAATLQRWLDHVQYGVPSLDPLDPKFESLRYWRGPVWAIMNYMITDGLRAYGFDAIARRVEDDTRELTGHHGLYEYFDPHTGQGAGGNFFSWTAAMCLAWLDRIPPSLTAERDLVLTARCDEAPILVASRMEATAVSARSVDVQELPGSSQQHGVGAWDAREGPIVQHPDDDDGGENEASGKLRHACGLQEDDDGGWHGGQLWAPGTFAGSSTGGSSYSYSSSSVTYSGFGNQPYFTSSVVRRTGPAGVTEEQSHTDDRTRGKKSMRLARGLRDKRKPKGLTRGGKKKLLALFHTGTVIYQGAAPPD
eukprot:SM000102S09218  [mRNA]  locus=s102:361883:369466:+ [translate_table: standard]